MKSSISEISTPQSSAKENGNLIYFNESARLPIPSWKNF